MNEKSTSRGFMFDTNIFNRILDNKIEIDPLTEIPLYATHLQHDELNKTRDESRREKLLEVFRKISPESIKTESAVWDISRWDECKFSDGFMYKDIKAKLDELKRKPNNIQDSLIAETAIKKNLVLVSDDKTLREVVNRLNGTTREFSWFVEMMEAKKRNKS